MINYNSMDKKYLMTAGVALTVFTLVLVSLIIFTKIKQGDDNSRARGIITDSDPNFSVKDLSQPLSGIDSHINPQVGQVRNLIYSLDQNSQNTNASKIKINPDTGEVDLSELKEEKSEEK